MSSFLTQFNFRRLYLRACHKGVPHDALRPFPRGQLEALRHISGLRVFDAGIQILIISTDGYHVHKRMPQEMPRSDDRSIGPAGASGDGVLLQIDPLQQLLPIACSFLFPPIQGTA